MNYADHASEFGADVPAHPTIFTKQVSCIGGPRDPVHLPRVSDALDYEGELVLVIGRRCRHVPVTEARRMIGGMRDITERKESENKLREQATLLDKAQDAILVRDLDHRILYWNRSAERLYGWTSSEILGHSIETLLYKDPAAFRAATRTTLEEGEWLGELQQVSRDGRTLTVEGRWSLVRDDDGRPRSILAINTDITERKLLEQQFLRAQRLESIGTLAGGIAHDLNNVLAPILMSIDLLNSVVAEPDAHEILDSVETSAKRGADMVKQVLSFARGAEGRRIDVQPRHLISDIVRISRDTFPKSIRIESQTDRDLWTLGADPTQLHQILLNLCVNARDAMPEGGTIRIRASNVTIDAHDAAMHLEATPGPHVRLEVTDDGHGIPASVLERIFDPFFTTKEVGQGTGLGLSTTMAIVRGHKGFIRVDSEPGEGTRFTIHFPALPGGGAGAGSDPAEGAMPRGRGETVLVVDDEQSVREVTRRTLEAHGYQVLVAADGAEGFSTFVKERARIRVILTDLLMPVMDGLTMVKALHRLDPEPPVIAASGFSPEDQSLEASHPEIVRFLAKPYTAECLLQGIRQALGSNDGS
jgi:PAS domain S-box-containing protein